MGKYVTKINYVCGCQIKLTMKKLFIATFQLKDHAFQQLIYALTEEQVRLYFEKINKESSFKITTIHEVIDISEHMHIITHTSPSSDPYFINVSFSVERNDAEWTSQPYHLPIEVWNEQKEIELKEEFKQFVLSKS